MDRFWSKVDQSAGPDGCWLWLAARTPRGYGVFRYQEKLVYAHRVAYEIQNGSAVDRLDHICGTPGCVNPYHLRPCTANENGYNSGKHSNNRSGFKGVYKDKPRGKWAAEIRIRGKKTHLGRFDSVEEAYAAYCSAAIEHHGEFANVGM